MNPFTLTIRAVGAALAMQLYIPIAIITGIWFAIFFGLTLWLTTLSEWWWLMMIPLTSLFLIVLTIGCFVLFLIRFVRPTQTKAQKRAVSHFTKRLQSIADTVSTPKFIILFHVVRSISSPSKDSYLADLASNKDLVKEFRELQRLFDA